MFIFYPCKFKILYFIYFTISDYYGVYTDVYTFLPWINSVLSVSLISLLLISKVVKSFEFLNYLFDRAPHGPLVQTPAPLGLVMTTVTMK
jgi:hypothetical protein